MNELSSILKAWRDARSSGKNGVLATVVHVIGSAYRRPGARMLILPDGQRLGTISGGCLEGDVARKVTWWTSDTGTVLRIFDNTTEDAAWEFGLARLSGFATLKMNFRGSNFYNSLISKGEFPSNRAKVAVVRTYPLPVPPRV
ncbi:MAG: XdhC family protein, partial [Pedosphaera sp.]|nr:XdhC family protein [Pedosphaera sp.]